MAEAMRTQIEQAIVARLAGKKYAAGGTGYLRAIEAYNGDLTGAEGVDDMKRLVGGRCPAVLVSTSDGSYQSIQVQRRKAILDLQVELLVIASSYRSREARTQGKPVAAPQPGEDPGIYRVIEDVRLALMGSTLGLPGVHPLAPVSERAVVHAPGFCIWQLVYKTDVEAFLPREEAADPDLTGIAGQLGGDMSPVLELETPT